MPENLAAPFLERRKWTVSRTNDPFGFKLLIHFLREGKQSNLEEAMGLQVPAGLRCPALLRTPHDLWQDSSGQTSLAKNGTSALVFKVKGGPKVWNLIERTSLKPTRIFSRWKLKFKNKLGDDETYYVKIRTKDATPHYGLNQFLEVWGAWSDEAPPFWIRVWNRLYGTPLTGIEDVLQTYPIPPLCMPDLTVVVMRERGEPIDNVKDHFETLSGLARSLLALKRNTDEFLEVVCHGDALCHNIVIDTDGRLHLIDFDEGQIIGGHREVALSRTVVWKKADHHDWMRALMYPNLLRWHAREYTSAQFAAVLLYWGLTLDAENDTLNKFLSTAMGLGEKLKGERKRTTNTPDDLLRDAQACNQELTTCLETLDQEAR